jgi:DNA-binding NarL/FixJ family response regulator
MMVCHCVTSNYFKKVSDTSKRKVYLDDTDYMQPSDGGAMRAVMEEDVQISRLREFFSTELRAIFDMLLQGYSMTEISRSLSYTPRELRKKVDRIRRKVAPSVGISY